MTKANKNYLISYSRNEKKKTDHTFLKSQVERIVKTKKLTYARVDMPVLLLMNFYKKAFLLRQLRTKVMGSQHCYRNFLKLLVSVIVYSLEKAKQSAIGE